MVQARFLMIWSSVVAIAATSRTARADDGRAVVVVEVRDRQLRPRAGVWVSAPGDGASTDARGRATLELPVGAQCVAATVDGQHVSACATVEPGRVTLLGLASAAGAPGAERADAGPAADPIRQEWVQFLPEQVLARADTFHAAALDARVDPTRLTTRLGGVRRLPGSLPLPLGMVEELDVAAARVGPDATSDTLALTARGGSNQPRQTLRLQGGRDLAADASVSGDVVHDKLFYSAAGAIDRTDEVARGGGLVQLDALTSARGRQRLVLLGLERRGETPARDLLAAWRVQRTIGDRSDATLDASAERQVRGDVATSRSGGAVTARHRRRAWGTHTLTVELGGGGGEVAAASAATMPVPHRDLSARVIDAWSPRPDLALEVGAGVHARAIGDETATVWTPGLAIAFDPTEEGDAKLYAGVGREALLDQGELGAWRSGPRAQDQVTAGVEWSLSDDGLLVVGAAYRGRRLVAGAPTMAVAPAHTEHGAEGAIAWGGTNRVLRVTASSLEKAVIGVGELAHNLGRGQQVVAIARAGTRAGVASVGAAIGYARRLGPYATQLLLEGLGTEDAAEARLVLSMNR
jgi:hypothetical protein